MARVTKEQILKVLSTEEWMTAKEVRRKLGLGRAMTSVISEHLQTMKRSCVDERGRELSPRELAQHYGVPPLEFRRLSPAEVLKRKRETEAMFPTFRSIGKMPA